MCSIVENLTNEARNEGRTEGIAVGKAEGIAVGKAEGIAEGIVKTLIGLVKDGILTMSEAAKRAGMSEAKFAEYMNKANL
jgi:flagellar biosynthesis/type III secretory pathway protein FliH